MRKFANSLLIEERLSRDREQKMIEDYARRHNLPVFRAQQIWEFDKKKALADARAKVKLTDAQHAKVMEEVREKDQLNRIMEEYECEEWQAKRIQAIRQGRANNQPSGTSREMGSRARKGGAQGRRAPEVTILRRNVPSDPESMGR